MVEVQQTALNIVHERSYARQAEDLAYYFAGELKMSRWQYLDTLPVFTPQPENYQGRFDILLLVQTPQPKLPLQRILDIVGLQYNPDVLTARDWAGSRFVTPEKAYLTYVEDGTGNLDTKPNIVRQNLSADERAGTLLDGTFLHVSDRGLVTRHYLDLPGSQVASGCVPYLCLWNGGPRFGCGWDGYAPPNSGSVVAGDKVVTK